MNLLRTAFLLALKVVDPDSGVVSAEAGTDIDAALAARLEA